MPRKARGRLIKNCEWCGNPIGAERGPAAVTCSPECQRDRNRDKERKRYRRVKDTDAWKETRSDYLRRTAERAATDPAFAERRAREHREAVRRYWKGLSPDQLEQYRAVRRAWFKNLTAEQRSLRKSWYRSLAPEQKQLFLTELRRKRAALQQKSGNQV